MTTPPNAWVAVRGRPWSFLSSRWPWRSLAYLSSTVPVGIVCLLFMLVLIGVGLLTMVVLVGLVLLAGVPRVASAVAEAERVRARLVLPRPEAAPGPTLRERLRARHALPIIWSEVGYVVLLATVLWLVDAVVLVFAAGVPVVLVLAPLLVRFGPVEVLGLRVDSSEEAFLAVGLGIVSVVASAYLVTAMASGQAALTRRLLDPPEARLVEAVAALRRSRVDLVEAFESERRRIERDLHDGVQQRLVALAMTLGRAELTTPSGATLELIQAARQQAEEALEDLRLTVRGIHPAVLTDHGLVAAVHDVADRCSVPVDTNIMVVGRLPAPVEAAAYFVISEALTNVARHAQARSAQVHAWTQDDRLVVTVIDDGIGGATVGRGSGLAGLALRLEAHDGTLQVHSPHGGPTEVRMECPIELD